MTTYKDDDLTSEFLDIQALVCKECCKCYDVYADGIPLDEFHKLCECGSNTFTIENGKCDQK